MDADDRVRRVAVLDADIQRVYVQLAGRHPDDELLILLDWQQIDLLLEQRHALTTRK